jgi:hybrid cluster-associated redox disulfide protein
MRGEGQIVGADSAVDGVMRACPSTIRAFLDFHMNCVGCPVGPFHTVRDACREYDVDLEAFLAALEAARRTAC